MEKIILTKKQANVIENFKDGFDNIMNGLTYDDFIKAVKDGYEVEPEYKVGDWVVSVEFDVVKRIEKIEKPEGQLPIYRLEDKFNVYTIRLATPSEIAEEKERRFFARHGREPWELKNNDILNDRRENCTVTIAKVIDKFPAEEMTVLFTNGDWEFYNNIVEDSDWRVACFADKRLDVKTND